MKRLWLVLLAGFALVGCQTTEQPMEATAVYRPTEADNAAIADAFDRVLREPDSARFPVIYARRGASGVIYYCGLVNSRNGFGGYTGNRPFYAVGDQRLTSVLRIGEDQISNEAVLVMCRRAGFVGKI